MTRFLMGLAQDIRYALRQLRRSPGFAITAVLTLGLGIGATATMYSVVRDVLLAPLPYPERDRLVGIGFTYPQAKPTAEQAGSTADFVREHNGSFESLAISEDAITGANLSGFGEGSRAVRVGSVKVSHGYLATLGLHPALGRDFTSQDDFPNGPRVALLNYWVWQRTSGGDASIVDRVVRINEEPFTIIGVLPKEISGTGESEGAISGDAGVWLPLQLSEKDPGYEGTNYYVIGRLRSGISVAQAQQDVSRLNAPLYERYPSYKGWFEKKGVLHEYRVWPLQSVIVSDVKRSLLVLFAAVAAVLLVACLNLAGLMTARAATRQRELALRTALGSTRWGLLRLLATESLVLAVAGSCIGLGLAYVAKPALLAAAPLSIPEVHSASHLWEVAAFVVGVASLTTVVCGLLPGWTMFRQDAQSALKGGQSNGSNAKQARVGKGLMIAQVATSMVLLSAACLLLGSFLKLRSTASGVQPRHLEIAQVSLKGDAYAATLHTTQFVEKVEGLLAHYPGVERIAAINGLPLDRGLNIGGRPVDHPEVKGVIEFRTISPGYFRTAGIPVMMGRDINDGDNAKGAPVAVISEAAARRFWPGKSPLGERVIVGGDRTFTVIGVVADVHPSSLAEAPQVTVYSPFAQVSDSMTKTINGWFPTTFVVRLTGDVDLAVAMQKAISEADPEMPVAKLTTMQSVIDDTVAAPRFFSWMAGGFAGFALLLTVIGLFGLLSYQVTQRTREIGVRLAIGSTRGEILRLMLRRGMMLTALGLVIGALFSLAVPRIVGSILEDNLYTGGAPIASVLSSSVAALGIAAGAMLVAAMLASYLPARRAAAVEPMEALRAE